MEREDLINGYFEQTLSVSELREFKNRVEVDIDFAEEVEFRKHVQSAITLTEREKIKSQLQDFETDMSAIPVKKIHIAHWISIAASLVVVVGASLWFWFYTNSSSSDQLYKNYYQPFPNVVQPIVRGGQASDDLNKAFIYYEEGSYHDAINIFAKYSDENSVFYAGLCEMELNEFAKAIPYFDKIITMKSTYVLYAKWYKALAYLKLNKSDEAGKILRELATEKEFDLKDEIHKLKNELQ